MLRLCDGQVHSDNRIHCLYKLRGRNLWCDNRTFGLCQLRVGHFLKYIRFDRVECVLELHRGQVLCSWSIYMYELRGGNLPECDGSCSLFELLC